MAFPRAAGSPGDERAIALVREGFERAGLAVAVESFSYDLTPAWRALRAVLCGEENGAHRDALLLGTSLALEITGKVKDPREGVARAREAIDSGAARRLLDSLAAFSAKGTA